MPEVTHDRLAGLSSRMSLKAPVRVATTANISLAGLQTIDAVVLAADDRVLVKDQTDARANGIYYAATGDWVRAPDFSRNDDIGAGTLVFVNSGTVGGGYLYRLTTVDPEIDTDNLTFAVLIYTGPVLSQPTLTLKQSANPTPTAEGDIQWDTNDDRIVVGDGATQKIFSADSVNAAAYQPLDSDLTSWAGVTRASGYDTFAATPSSANLRALLTDETGTGAAVFATSPTISDLTVTTAVQLPGGAGAFNIDTFSNTGASSGKQTTAGAILNSSRNSTGNVGHQNFYNPNGLVGGINTNGSATAFNTSSDYRLKDDVTPLVTFSLEAEDFAYLPDPLRLIMLIDPVSYVWRVDPNGPRSHGFIAHELQKVFPHAVSGEKDAVTALGIIVIPAWREPDTDGPKDEDGNATVIRGALHAERIVADVPEDEAAERYPNGVWSKTGERVDPQGVDYSKLVTDLTAAVQALTVIVLEQKRRLDAAGM